MAIRYTAASVARDPRWKGGALYRDQQYEEAADAFAENDDPTADYNRGNALARSGRLRDALAAYDTVLETDPRHADALHNRTLVARLMEQLRQRSRQQQTGWAIRRPGATGADTGATEQANFTALGDRHNQIDYLDAGFEQTRSTSPGPHREAADGE